VGGYLGVRGQFTPKVSGTVKAGYYASDFADGSAGPSGPGVEATVGWQIDSRTYASLSYSRKPSVQLQYARQASVLDWATLQVGRQFGATLKYSVGLRLSFGHNDYDARELTSAEGQMLGLPAGLQLYPAKADQYYRAGLDLAYRIRLWLKAALSYEYEARTSNGRGAIDYGVNRVTMSMVLGY
jgi:hypothetical protein